MLYEMEELVPIVGRLAEKYTAYESSSMTYEKAEQLMEAVLYCIHEAEQSGHNSVIPTGGISAQQAYDTGLVYVQEKAKKHWIYITGFYQNLFIIKIAVFMIPLSTDCRNFLNGTIFNLNRKTLF